MNGFLVEVFVKAVVVGLLVVVVISVVWTGLLNLEFVFICVLNRLKEALLVLEDGRFWL